MFAGMALIALSIYFLAGRFQEHQTALSQTAFYAKNWGPMLIMSVGYGASLILLVVAWGRCLFSGKTFRTNLAVLVEVYGLSNLAKYLPGGIFHLAGRQVLVSQLGWKQLSVAAATTIELVLHVLVSAAIAVCLISIAPEYRQSMLDFAGQSIGIRTVVLAGIILALIGGLWLKLPEQFNKLGSVVVDWKCFPIAIALQAIFFVCMAMLFAATLDMTGQRELNDQAVLVLSGVYLLSWILGLLTPGAPGGLAVREAIFVLLSGKLGFAVDAMLAACIMMRIVTTVGEVWLAVLAGSLKAVSR